MKHKPPSERPEARPDPGKAQPGPTLLGYLEERVSGLHPACFSLAMATGIVAIACHLLGLDELAAVLASINWVAYLILWALFITRLVRFREQLLADLLDHARAPGFFTMVAATGVLGTQAVLLQESIFVGQLLWWASLVLWALCTYTVFALLTVGEQKPTLSEGINGGWLVAVVAAQSVCVLGCALEGSMLGDRDLALFMLMCFWLSGGMLYLWIIGLIFYRYMFFEFSPCDLMPPYWINMGAVAISTLAGALLADLSATSPLLSPLRPFMLGLTVMFWATATWWIPMLLVLGIWRHRFRGVPFGYDLHYWGLVFPFGMYSVCTLRLAVALDAPFLLWIARIAAVAAATVWLLTFLGLLGRLLYALLLGLRRPQEQSPRQPDERATLTQCLERTDR